MANLPYKWKMLIIVETGGEVYGNSILSSHIFCRFKAILKHIIYLKRKPSKMLDEDQGLGPRRKGKVFFFFSCVKVDKVRYGVEGMFGKEKNVIII